MSMTQIHIYLIQKPKVQESRTIEIDTIIFIKLMISFISSCNPTMLASLVMSTFKKTRHIRGLAAHLPSTNKNKEKFPNQG